MDPAVSPSGTSARSRLSRRRALQTGLAALVLPLVVACGSAGLAGTGSGGKKKGGDPPPNERSPLGINLSEVAFWSSEYPFVDCFKTSTPFLHQTRNEWNLNTPLDLRPDGYPARLADGHFAGALMFREIGVHYPSGRYTCLYDGDGDIEFGFAARAIESHPGRIIVDVTPNDSGIYLRITRTNPADPVRNIRLLMPGYDANFLTQPFHSDFLDRWKECSVVRFMDWGRTNDSTLRTWADRTLPTYQTQATEHGVAIEYMLLLANTLKADPWICIPHQADNDYVRSLAKLAARGLDPGLKLWIEYSNEVWNAQFKQANYCEQQGLSAGLSTNPYGARLRYYSKRAVEVFQICERELGQSRMVRVIAAQSANSWTSSEILGYQDAHESTDALAIAPYFGYELGHPSSQWQVAAMSEDQVLNECQDLMLESINSAKQHLTIAKSYGLDLVAYEGGQHLAGFNGSQNNAQLNDLFHRVNRRVEMGNLYTRYFAAWAQMGGSTFCAFNSAGKYTQWGSWGAFEYYDAPLVAQPKYQAMMWFANSR